MVRQHFDQRTASKVFAYADLGCLNQTQPGEACGVIGVRVVDDHGSRHREGPVLAGLGVLEAFAPSPECAHVVDQIMLCQIRKGLRGSASAQVVRARAVDEDQTSQWPGDQLRVPRRPGTHYTIKTLLDWIDETIRRAQLAFDLGMRLEKLGQMRNYIQTRDA